VKSEDKAEKTWGGWEGTAMGLGDSERGSMLGFFDLKGLPSRGVFLTGGRRKMKTERGVVEKPKV